MATISFPERSKITRLPSGVTYSYTHFPAHGSQPTILFIHGFPSSSYDWRHQITYFSSLGYGIVAPDLLGYGETDKPKDLADYRGTKMAAELNELLDYVKVQKVHGVAHDWGSFLLSRLANYYPERLISSAFLATAYRPPGQSMNVDPFNLITKEKLGYEMYGYWKFFEREDAGQVVKDHIKSFLSLLYPAKASDWREYMAPLGALEAFATADKVVERGDYVSDAELATHQKIMGDNYDAPTNWYKAAMRNVNLEEEKSANPDPNLKGPVLMIVASMDPLSNEVAIQGMKPYAQDLNIVRLDCGHWVQMEKRNEVNAALENHFKSVS